MPAGTPQRRPTYGAAKTGLRQAYNNMEQMPTFRPGGRMPAPGTYPHMREAGPYNNWGQMTPIGRGGGGRGGPMMYLGGSRNFDEGLGAYGQGPRMGQGQLQQALSRLYPQQGMNRAQAAGQRGMLQSQMMAQLQRRMQQQAMMRMLMQRQMGGGGMGIY